MPAKTTRLAELEAATAAAALSLPALLLEFECVGTSRRRAFPELSDLVISREVARRAMAGQVPARPFAVVSTAGGAVISRHARMSDAERNCCGSQAVKILTTEE